MTTRIIDGREAVLGLVAMEGSWKTQPVCCSTSDRALTPSSETETTCKPWRKHCGAVHWWVFFN